MTASLKLISHKLCPYVQRAVIALTEKGIEFERIDIDLGNKPEWFLAISPLGKTPVLQVGDVAIFESAVILEYLEETEAKPLHPVDPLRRDFRGSTVSHEAEIVEGDLADIDSCAAVLASFAEPDEGTAMEAWYAHSTGIPVVVWTDGAWAHPWTVYVAASLHPRLEDAVAALDGLMRPA